MIDFLILNWIFGLLGGLILLLGAFFISFAIDKLHGNLKIGVLFLVIATFLFAILSFVMSINRLLVYSQSSSSQYLWEPFTLFFGATFFTLGSMWLHYEIKYSEDFTWGKKKLLNAMKESTGKKLKYDFHGGL